MAEVPVEGDLDRCPFLRAVRDGDLPAMDRMTTDVSEAERDLLMVWGLQAIDQGRVLLEVLR